MAIATYADLQAAIAGYLARSDTGANVGTWIALAEARIGRELRVDQMLSRGVATLTNEFGTVPTDFLAASSMRLSGGTRALLEFLTQEQMARLQEVQTSGATQAYARVGGEFWFYPPPTDGDEVELIYYAAIPALSDANTSNWLLAAFPDVYLRATMVEAALFYEDTELLTVYSQLFSDSIGAITAASKRDAFAANINASPSAFPV